VREVSPWLAWCGQHFAANKQLATVTTGGPFSLEVD
jgi:hypothetical protein